MNKYLVCWETMVEADGPRDAARAALAEQRDGTTARDLDVWRDGQLTMLRLEGANVSPRETPRARNFEEV